MEIKILIKNNLIFHLNEILFQENPGHKKTPTILTNVGVFKIGVDLLSHPQKDSTISASRLNFSVRNGKRWTVLL